MQGGGANLITIQRLSLLKPLATSMECTHLWTLPALRIRITLDISQLLGLLKPLLRKAALVRYAVVLDLYQLLQEVV